MNRRKAIALMASAAAIPVFSPGSALAAASSPQADLQLTSLLQDAYLRTLELSPMLGATVGSTIGTGRWDDFSADGEDALHRAAALNLRRLQAIDFDALSPDAQVQYRAFESDQNIIAERYRWRRHDYPLNQIVGLHIDVPNVLINQHPIRNLQDAEDYISRLNLAPLAFDQMVARLQDHAAHGFYMASSIYPLLISGSRQIITGAPFEEGDDSPVWSDFSRKISELDVDPFQRETLLERARDALTGPFKGGYERLIAELEVQAAAAPSDAGVWSLPDGDEYYEFLIRQFTTTQMTPAEIHELGLSEVKRIHGEMQAIMDQVGFTGSLQQFMDQLKKDPQFYYPNTDEGRQAYLERARGIIGAMNDALPRAFHAKAPLPLVIRRAEIYREPTLPAAYFDAGSPDGSRPGYIYLNLSDMANQATFDLDALLYHEGVPGHHMQISTILVNDAVPELRKTNQWWQNTSFVEGWALYAEYLAKEMGFYQDPYADFGRLGGELWRACRLVVDSGLHYKRWSREQATQYLDDNTASTHAANKIAVDRYVAVPGQATAFTIGMKAFQKQRARAEEALGSAYDIRDYHEVALNYGFLPLPALDTAIDNWIASARAD
ncbi:DUF885 domain-containing protein [Altericroceibacterium endophyticum]|uniref:DUF885 family protein n=1 Tax=Altericroceibacterium endophyticum TaxID=1808508 RepID=A0A6I4T7W6_9SPHN|nr:DUF885 domain-containing protein [Altericroceibacterium endophyticum]MXO67056.1 DUF885 family protein [Altericroceibacterium endophyticum]